MKVIVRRAAVLVLVAVLTAACSKVPGVYVYEKDGQAAARPGVTDPKSYVADNWAARIVPTGCW